MANMTFKTNLLPNSTTLEYSLGSEDQPWKINGYNIEDTYVHISGDTMLGLLKTKGLAGTEDIDYGEVLPATGVDGQLFFQISDDYTYELPDGGTTGQALIKNSDNDRDVKWSNTVIAANTATKATQDKNGLQIDTGYLKLTGGTVTGTLILSRTTDASGTADNKPALIIGGASTAAHIEIDPNEIIAKSNGTTPTILYLQDTTGTVNVAGSGGLQVFNGGLDACSHVIASTKTAGNAYNQNGSAIQIREVNRVGTAQTAWTYAPKIGFHWSGKCAVQLGMDSSQNLRLYTNNSTTGGTFIAGKVYGAVWNDYAEMRNIPEAQENLKTVVLVEEEEIIKDNTEKIPMAGRCVYEIGDDTMALTTHRLQKGCKIISDTFGFNIGETKNAHTPVAVSGRVLAYLLEDREIAKEHIGDFICSGPNGTVSIMTTEEYFKCPQAVVGTISAVPDYEEWGTGHVKVDGRIWIYVR